MQLRISFFGIGWVARFWTQRSVKIYEMKMLRRGSILYMWETVKHHLMTVLVILIIGKSECELVRLGEW